MEKDAVVVLRNILSSDVGEFLSVRWHSCRSERGQESIRRCNHDRGRIGGAGGQCVWTSCAGIVEVTVWTKLSNVLAPNRRGGILDLKVTDFSARMITVTNRLVGAYISTRTPVDMSRI